MLKKLNAFFKKLLKVTAPQAIVVGEPRIIPRSEHSISRKQISRHALKVLYRLREAGFSAYLVGGCVRDLLLGREPKDFDVATNAEPEQVHQLFHGAILIGRRFRLVHVRFYGEIIEVATFRQGGFVQDDEKHRNEHGMIVRDNQYGTISEDVIRRDFTVNALYYNIADFSVVDFMNGMHDLEAGLLRIIGDPVARFREDPVRILRAVRFATKLSFRIEPLTEAAIPKTASLLAHVAPARLFDEALKLLSAGYGVQTFALLRQYNLLKYLFPMTDQILQDPLTHQEVDTFLMAMLQNTDQRLAENKGVNPAFMIAAMLWYPYQQAVSMLIKEKTNLMIAKEESANQVLSQQIKYTAVPRRLTNTVREIWQIQYHLEKRKPHRARSLVTLHRFRAGYDFLLLRSKVELNLVPIANWWTAFYEADEQNKENMVNELSQPKKRRPRKKKTELNPS